MIEATSASPSTTTTTTTASSRLFVTAEGEPREESRIDLRVIGNPSAVNLGKLVSTSSPRDLLLFPSGDERKKFLRRQCLPRRLDKFDLTFKRSREIYIHTSKILKTYTYPSIIKYFKIKEKLKLIFD